MEKYTWLTYLVGMAEVEECKEATLRYFFVLKIIYARNYDIPMNFEMNGRLAKLQKSSLLSCSD